MKINTYLEKTDRTRLSLCNPELKSVRRKLEDLLKSAHETDLGDVQPYICERLQDLMSITINNPLGILTTRQLDQFNEDLLDQMSLIYHATGEPDFKATLEVGRFIRFPRR